MEDFHKRLIAVAALVLGGAAVGFPLGAYLSTSGSPALHGEDVMARALTALFIGGPIGALVAASMAGFVGYRYWRQPTGIAIGIAWIVAIVCIVAVVRMIGST